MKKLTEYLNQPGFYYCKTDSLGEVVILVLQNNCAYFLLGCGQSIITNTDDWEVFPLMNPTISGTISLAANIKMVKVESGKYL